MVLTKARKSAEQIEAKLLAHAEDIAAILRRPKPDRDVAEANLSMMKMNGLRPQLRRLLREYEKVLARKDASFAPKTNLADGRIDRYFRGVRFRLRQWRMFEQLVEDQILREGGELFPAPPEDDIYFRRISEALSAMETALHRLANPNAQSDAARENGYFPDIPLPSDQFIENIHAAYRVCLALGKARPLRFLDVGAGGGTKLTLARLYFDLADGLEYDPGYVAAAERMFEICQAARCRVIEGDGLTFEDYSAYDVIYFYRPIQDTPLLHQLEERIVQQARPGTVLVAPYDPFVARAEELGVPHIARRVYVTGLSEAQADDLRERAEAIGLDVAPPGLVTEPRVGFWGPVAEVSLANGWRPKTVKYKPSRDLSEWD